MTTAASKVRLAKLEGKEAGGEEGDEEEEDEEEEEKDEEPIVFLLFFSLGAVVFPEA